MDKNNFGPRIGFNWSTADARTQRPRRLRHLLRPHHAGDQSLERGLDGRALPIEVRAGNVFFLDPNGQFPPFAPNISNPFTGFVLPGAGAGGINIIDNTMQNPRCSSSTSASSTAVGGWLCCASTASTTHGTHFIIGRTIGSVFNPVVGGPDRVVNLESSVRHASTTRCCVSSERASRGTSACARRTRWPRRSTTPTTTRSRSATGRSTPNDLQQEYGPTPNDQRHRFTLAGVVGRAGRLQLLGDLDAGVGRADGHPAARRARRIPTCSATPAAASSTSPAELNAYLLSSTRAAASPACRCRSSASDAKFNDSFNSSTFASRGRSASGTARRSSRCSRSSTSSTSRTSSARRTELLGLRQRAGRATAATRRRPAS